jgi:serine protease
MALITLVWSGRGIQASTKGLSDFSDRPVGKNYQIQTGLLSIPTDHIILKYKSSSTAFMSPSQSGQMDRLNTRAGTTLDFVRSMSDNSIVLSLTERLPIDQVQEIVDQLRTLPEVEYAEPDVIMQHTLEPNDPLYSDQWHYFAPSAGNYGINAPAAWDITTGSSSIVVAVIDTGITNHIEFVGRTVPGYDFISDVQVANDGNGRDSDPSDPGDWITAAENDSGIFAGCGVRNSSWHGTHTAGTIGAASNNGTGVAGINWNSKILPVRVLGKCGGYTSDIIDAMNWAAGLNVSGVPANANPAKVENLSLGGSGSCGIPLQNAINAITAAGATIVVSAGNSNADAINFMPANCNGVITVAATNRIGSRAGYSNYGSTVEISAPGGDTSNGILSTLNTGTQGPVADTYAYYQGTSMAAPHVSGVISLLYSLNPALTSSQVLQIIQNTATNFPAGSSCDTSMCGSGIVNAGTAIASIVKTLSVTKSGSGSGIVTSTPAGIICGSGCSAFFNNNIIVTLTATNDSDSTFTGWSGEGCTGTGACIVTMSAARSVTATFTLNVHSISLYTGWNLVSFKLHPVVTAIATVLSGITGKYDLVYAWDATGANSGGGNWMIYDPNRVFGNTLTNLNETMGFWIHMTTPATLDVVGRLPTTTSIPLSINAGGWNLVGYPSAANLGLPGALNDHGVGTAYSLVYAYDANDTGGPWKLYNRSAIFGNDLTQLAPGWGYWIYVSGDSTWNVGY